MVVPFRNLIAEAFGYPKINLSGEAMETEDEKSDEEVENSFEDEEIEDNEGDDAFVEAQKLAVQILTELQFTRQDDEVENVQQICRAIVKTSNMKDEDVTRSLALALKAYKIKQAKFLIKEIYNLFD